MRITLAKVYNICTSWSHFLLSNPKAVRFVIPWVASLKSNRNPLKDEEPWVTFEAKEWLISFLTKNMIVFEYGQGGSTIFFSKRVKKLISVEHDRLWYQLVKKVINKNNIRNCELICVEPERCLATLNNNFMDPRNYASGDARYKNMHFETYVKTIELFPDESFDLVFIDGRARPSCILHSRSKVRPGGFIMLDNSERERYQMSKDLLIDWEQRDYYGPGPYSVVFWQTSIFRKPQQD